MDEKYILEKIEEIKAMAGDDENAHILEDILYADFIEYISKREDHLGKKARLILTTNDIKFARWYV